MIRRAVLLSLALLCAAHAFAGNGKIIVINGDGAGVGFNDPTPATPVGGNPGTTIGQQRLNVIQAVAERWQNSININVDIRVSARFLSLAPCDATSGVLANANPVESPSDFPGAPQSGVRYPIALANTLANQDLSPASDDIIIRFNLDIDKSTCLGDSSWYYGLDANEGTNVDMFTVGLHELAHGLGFAGGFSGSRPSVFDTHIFDVQAGKRWNQMTSQERSISAVNTGNLVWDGPNVRDQAPRFLQAVTVLTVTEPTVVAKNYDIGTAAFGPAASSSTAAGRIAIANDTASEAGGPSATDACSAITNPSAIAGRLALVDRGSCTFVSKARNVQAAGAIGMIVVDNTRDTCLPPGMGGTAPDVTIPVISISANDGDVLKAQLNASTPVQAALRLDGGLRAGTAGPQGYVRLYAPCTAEPGSSTYHFDVTASPNLLMEPSVNSDLLHGVDLTVYQLLDIGWSLPPRTGRRVLKK